MHLHDGDPLPPELTIPMQMQQYGLKLTDYWDFIRIPRYFVKIWGIVDSAVTHVRQELSEAE